MPTGLFRLKPWWVGGTFTAPVVKADKYSFRFVSCSSYVNIASLRLPVLPGYSVVAVLPAWSFYVGVRIYRDFNRCDVLLRGFYPNSFKQLKPNLDVSFSCLHL